MRRVIEKDVNALPFVIRKTGRDLIGTVFVDATAGDASDPDSSPRLILGHRQRLRDNRLLAPCYFFERTPKTFATLRANLGYEASIDRSIHVLPEDATEGVLRVDHHRYTLLYIDDPNQAGGSTITDEVAAWVFENEMATLFLSIGANAGGVARLGPQHYEQCREKYLHVLDLASRVRPFKRDVVYCKIPNDSHRWAYAIIGSARFTETYAQTLGHIATPVVGFRAATDSLLALFSAKQQESERLPFVEPLPTEPMPSTYGTQGFSKSARPSSSAPAADVNGVESGHQLSLIT